MMDIVETVMLLDFLLVCCGIRHEIMSKARHFLHQNYA